MSSSRATTVPNSAPVQNNTPPTTPHTGAPAAIQRPVMEVGQEDDDDSEDDDLDGSSHLLIGLIVKTLHSA